MSDFFSGIVDFFSDIFSGDPKAAQLRKELRHLHQELASFRPLVFQKKTLMVLPGLAQSFYELYNLMAPLYDLFQKTLNHTEKKMQDLSLQYLIESNLVGDITDRRLRLNYESIQTRLADSSQSSTEANRITADFNSLLSEIKRQNLQQINKDINELICLKNLALHNFFSFFQKFGVALTGFESGSKSFTGVDGDEVLSELLDLYYLLAKINISPNTEKGLITLLERLNPQGLDSNRKKLQKVMSKIQNLLTGSCSTRMLLCLIKVIRTDPLYKPEIQKSNDDWIQEYLEDIQRRFQQDRDRALRELNEDSLTKEIAALFGSAKLLSVDGYDPETNQNLTVKGVGELAHIKPFTILKSYIFSILKTFYLDSMKALLLDAFYSEKEWGTQLGNHFYVVEALPERLQSFEKTLNGDGKISLDSLEKNARNKATLGVARKILEQINRSANDFLEEETQVIAKFAALTLAILKDYKSPQPENITNIKGLGGQKNKEIIQGLADGYNKTLQYLKIMKSFIVLKGISNQSS